MKTMIENKLQELISHMKEGPIREAALYSLMAGGKRIRPIFMLSTIKSYGLNEKDYVDIACALEMVHTYSLIHDDLPAMDDDDLRRGKPTCHKVYGEATAILAGDALLTEAFYVISMNKKISADKKLQLIQILADCAGQNGMIYGQQQDLYYENHECDLDNLKEIHHYKTARLIEASFMMASTIASEKDIHHWKTIGTAIGQAFQIQDDLLDAIGNEKELGKKTGMDAVHHKATYVSLLGIEEAKVECHKWFQKALSELNDLPLKDDLVIQLIKGLVDRHV